MERNQFTFYRSFWEAAKALPAKDRNAVLNAICSYALDGEEPGLSGVQASIFILIRPTLDASARKAENGAAGGSKSKANAKQSESKAEAKGKQTAREKEREDEGEKEGENEVENECSPPIAPKGASTFDRFWKVYPKKVGKDAARRAFARAKVPVETLIAAVEEQKASEQWTRDNGQYIPNPATWLNQGRWQDELETARPKGAPSMDYGDQTENMERMRKMIAAMGGTA